MQPHYYIISRFGIYYYFCMTIPPSMKDVIVLLCSMGTWDLLRVLLLHACAIFSPKSDFFIWWRQWLIWLGQHRALWLIWLGQHRFFFLLHFIKYKRRRREVVSSPLLSLMTYVLCVLYTTTTYIFPRFFFLNISTSSSHTTHVYMW